MGTISYTIPTAGSTLNSVADPEISTALSTIQTWANGNVDGANVVASLTGRRLALSGSALIPGGQVAGNYFLAADGTLVASGAGSSKALIWAQLDSTTFSVVGKSTQLVLRMSVATNAIAPAVNFQGKLASVTFGGGVGVIAPTLSGTALSALVTTPSASSATVSESGASAFPSTGAYAPVINLDGTAAANSITSILWQLYALNS